MPNQKPSGDMPAPEHGKGDTAPTSSKTIRMADIKNRAPGKSGANATPAIKPVKVILALPSRPAPETADTAPQRERASPPAQPKAKSGAIAAASQDAIPAPTALPAPTPSKKPAKPASAALTKAQSPNATPSGSLTPGTLPLAVGELFALNNYDVEYGKKIHGAEVDIVATPKGGRSGRPYIWK